MEKSELLDRFKTKWDLVVERPGMFACTPLDLAAVLSAKLFCLEMFASHRVPRSRSFVGESVFKKLLRIHAETRPPPPPEGADLLAPMLEDLADIGEDVAAYLRGYSNMRPAARSNAFFKRFKRLASSKTIAPVCRLNPEPYETFLIQLLEACEELFSIERQFVWPLYRARTIRRNWNFPTCVVSYTCWKELSIPQKHDRHYRPPGGFDRARKDVLEEMALAKDQLVTRLKRS